MANDSNGVVACVERATNDTLIDPDWAINLELCDRINMNPGQAKDALKILKKKLATKNPKIQLLALFVLETLSKNCGENIFQQIVERDILHDMVKIVKKKPDENVREKILVLIDTWQEAFGGRGGRHPQYYASYKELKSAGVDFPPREENIALLFTPPQAHSIVRPISSHEEVAIQASLQTDTSGLGLSEIVTAQGLANVLMDMLSALDPHNKMAVQEELIVDLVDQCHSYQNRVMTLVTTTSDEELLSKGLALNDILTRVLRHHDDIATGEVRGPENATIPLVNDDYSQLSPRSSRNTLNQNYDNEPFQVSPLSPPPTSSTEPIPTAPTVDHLSGEVHNSSRPSKATKRHVKFADQPTYNEPTQFTSSTESGSSYDGLVGQTRDMSINTRSTAKNEKREDLLFQDLVDFAKAKSNTTNPKRFF